MFPDLSKSKIQTNHPALFSLALTALYILTIQTLLKHFLNTSFLSLLLSSLLIMIFGFLTFTLSNSDSSATFKAFSFPYNTNAINILPNIIIGKDNQTMKFGHLNILLENHTQNVVGKMFPSPVLKHISGSIVSNFVTFSLLYNKL